MTAVMIWVFPKRTNASPCVFRGTTVLVIVMGRATCSGRESGLTLDSVNFCTYPYDTYCVNVMV